jgi:E3 ubiquitin-protein ligase EDD1
LAAEDGDGEGSEQEDGAERSGGVGVGNGEAMEAEVGDLVGGVGRQGDDAQGDGESDNELDLLAETESDSDDNHSNQDAASAQRSVQTGATAGSDTGNTAWDIIRKSECSFIRLYVYKGVSKSLVT